MSGIGTARFALGLFGRLHDLHGLEVGRQYPVCYLAGR